nr:hypothetical protein [uncultured Cohaesibacter sp.]
MQEADREGETMTREEIFTHRFDAVQNTVDLCQAAFQIYQSNGGDIKQLSGAVQMSPEVIRNHLKGKVDTFDIGNASILMRVMGQRIVLATEPVQLHENKHKLD